MLETFESINNSSWGQDINNNIKNQAIRALESGKVLFFPKLAFKLTSNEKLFLSPKFADPKSKNISYQSTKKQIKGVEGSEQERLQLMQMMQRFSAQATDLINSLMPQYQVALHLGRTSFRPVEIKHRETSYRKDDTRLHVDAFPSSPNQGKRILRVFSNVHPYKNRVWRLGEPFEEVAERFLRKIRGPLPGSSFILKTLGITKTKRTAYDHYMLRIHDSMKADLQYQENANQMEFAFPPGCSWIVMTDHVSHAAMQGQHALEQTFYIPTNIMQDESLAPVRVLERRLKTRLV